MKVIVNGLTAKQALKLCDLTDTVQTSTVYSRVKARKEKGIYNNEIRKEQKRKLGLVIKVPLDDGSNSQDDDISPLTSTTINSLFINNTTGKTSLPSTKSSSASSNKIKKHENLQDKQVLPNLKQRESGLTMITDTRKHSKMQPPLLH